MKKSARFVKKTLQQTRRLSLAYQSDQFAPQFFFVNGGGTQSVTFPSKEYVFWGQQVSCANYELDVCISQVIFLVAN